jgi:hypothetical protein
VAGRPGASPPHPVPADGVPSRPRRPRGTPGAGRQSEAEGLNEFHGLRINLAAMIISQISCGKRRAPQLFQSRPTREPNDRGGGHPAQRGEVGSSIRSAAVAYEDVLRGEFSPHDALKDPNERCWLPGALWHTHRRKPSPDVANPPLEVRWEAKWIGRPINHPTRGSDESEGYRRRFSTNGAGGGSRVLCPPQGLANAPPVERGGRVDLELLPNFAPDLDSSGLTSPP